MYISVNIFYVLFIFIKSRRNHQKKYKTKTNRIRFIDVFEVEYEYNYRLEIGCSLDFYMIFIGFIITSFTYFDTNKSSVKLGMPFQCSECDFMNYLIAMQEHVNESEIDNVFLFHLLIIMRIFTYYILVVLTSKEGMPFQCTECDLRKRWCKIRNNLHIHSTYNVDLNIFMPYAEEKQCHFSIFSHTIEIITHSLHTGEKPFKCNQRGNVILYTKNLEELVSHEPFHTKEKAYQCSQCNENPYNTISILCHKSVSYNLKPLTCCLVIIIRLFGFIYFMESKDKQKLPLNCSECDFIKECWILMIRYMFCDSYMCNIIVILLSKTTHFHRPPG